MKPDEVVYVNVIRLPRVVECAWLTEEREKALDAAEHADGEPAYSGPMNARAAYLQLAHERAVADEARQLALRRRDERRSV